jgi:APA family basic amino acid/polyamine antiporter
MQKKGPQKKNRAEEDVEGILCLFFDAGSIIRKYVKNRGLIMENKLTKKYGLWTAVCMVVGIVIGSGVFFKAQTILTKTGGNMPLGIWAWIIGGMIMMVCALAFSQMAQRYEKVNGIVDYAEATVGSRYAYYVGWFVTTIYYPAMTSVLAWLSARYTLVFLTSVAPNMKLIIPASEGGCAVGPECMALTMFYLCAAYAVNGLSPKLSGKIQVSTTVIKMIPLILMAVGGVVFGLINGTLGSNFHTAAAAVTGSSNGNLLLAAVCSTAFAYEGWIIVTSINAEIKDAKKNLPRALVIGCLIIAAIYVFYYIGVAGGASNQELISQGATAAFVNVFGNVFGNILNLFVAVSCIGTMNGLMLGTTRGLYALSARGEGPSPKMFAQVDASTNMPNNSAIIGLILCAAWGLYFFLADVAQMWTGPFVFDSSELPIITIYGFYLPILIQWIRKAKDLSILQRFVIPSAAIAGSYFMIYASLVSHGIENLWYLIVFAVIMVIGRFLNQKNHHAVSK